MSVELTKQEHEYIQGLKSELWGRDPADAIIQIRLPKQIKDAFMQMAEERNRSWTQRGSASQLLRAMIEKQISSYAIKNKTTD